MHQRGGVKLLDKVRCLDAGKIFNNFKLRATTELKKELDKVILTYTVTEITKNYIECQADVKTTLFQLNSMYYGPNDIHHIQIIKKNNQEPLPTQ